MVRAGNTDYASGEHLEHAHACFDSVSPLPFLLMLARLLCLRVFSLLSACMKNNNSNNNNKRKRKRNNIHSFMLHMCILMMAGILFCFFK